MNAIRRIVHLFLLLECACFAGSATAFDLGGMIKQVQKDAQQLEKNVQSSQPEQKNKSVQQQTQGQQSNQSELGKDGSFGFREYIIGKDIGEFKTTNCKPFIDDNKYTICTVDEHSNATSIIGTQAIISNLAFYDNKLFGIELIVRIASYSSHDRQQKNIREFESKLSNQYHNKFVQNSPKVESMTLGENLLKIVLPDDPEMDTFKVVFINSAISNQYGSLLKQGMERKSAQETLNNQVESSNFCDKVKSLEVYKKYAKMIGDSVRGGNQLISLEQNLFDSSDNLLVNWINGHFPQLILKKVKYHSDSFIPLSNSKLRSNDSIGAELRIAVTFRR